MDKNQFTQMLNDIKDKKKVAVKKAPVKKAAKKVVKKAVKKVKK